MIYKVKSIEVFERQAKKLYKKYPSLKNELVDLVRKLQENPNLGTAIGKNCYKIRLAIKSKGKGKAGGSRVITHFLVSQQTVFLLSIYDKSERDNLTVREVEELLRLIKRI